MDSLSQDVLSHPEIPKHKSSLFPPGSVRFGSNILVNRCVSERPKVTVNLQNYIQHNLFLNFLLRLLCS